MMAGQRDQLSNQIFEISLSRDVFPWDYVVGHLKYLFLNSPRQINVFYLNYPMTLPSQMVQVPTYFVLTKRK